MVLISIALIIYFCIGAIWAAVMVSEYWDKHRHEYGESTGILISVWLVNTLLWPLSIPAYYIWWK